MKSITKKIVLALATAAVLLSVSGCSQWNELMDQSAQLNHQLASSAASVNSKILSGDWS